ncbi:MAG: hypothetical protein JNK10_05000 [Cyclobacteriaceae bacterium]|nr:hypothetical protein [Cyclobacteriaceae bacterium]
MKILLRYSMMLMMMVGVLTIFAQAPVDKIHNKDGTIVQAKVLEILPTEIKYKKASNPDGPTYTILKSDVTKIVYANGEEEVMKGAPAKKGIPTEEIAFGSDNFLTFRDSYMITDFTLPDKTTNLCFWDYDMKLKAMYKFENRQVNEGVYYWQAVAENGNFLKGSVLYDKDMKVLTRFVNPRTEEPFKPKSDIAVISPDGARIVFKSTSGAGGYSDGNEYVFLFDNEGKLLSMNKFKGDWVQNIQFSHSGNQFMVVRRSNAIIFDANGTQTSMIDIGKEMLSKYQTYTRYGDYNMKTFVNFSVDDQLIAAPFDDELVSVWDTKGTLVKSFPHFHATVAAISPDNKWVVTAGCLPYGKTVKRKGADGVTQTVSGGQIKVWTMDGTLVKEMAFPLDVSSVEFTPNNSGLVAIAEGVPVWLWAEDNFALEEGLDVALDKLAVEVAAAKEADRKADNARRWGYVLKGFVDGLPKALDNMSKEAAKGDKQRRRISEISKSGQSTSGTNNGTRKGQRLQIAIGNKTTKDVESVYISPRESPHWSEDILGKDLLFKGETGTLTIPSDYGKGCSFDMKVVYPDGKTAVWQSLDFCKYYTFELFPNGKVVFSVD